MPDPSDSNTNSASSNKLKPLVDELKLSTKELLERKEVDFKEKKFEGTALWPAVVELVRTSEQLEELVLRCAQGAVVREVRQLAVHTPHLMHTAPPRALACAAAGGPTSRMSAWKSWRTRSRTAPGAS